MEIKKAAGWLMGVVGVLTMAGNGATAQSQTAQSAMADLTLDSTAYQIEGTITWTFHRGNHNSDLTDTAMSYYENKLNGTVPARTCTGGGANGCQTAPATPLAPEPDDIELQQQAQADQCVFFAGGSLTSRSYTQTVTVNVNSPAPASERGSWKFTYNYDVVPKAPVVPQYTAWSSAQTGGTVDVGFTGFVASESFQKQSNRIKYSFTMIDGGVTRALGVTAMLAGAASGSLDLNNVDTDQDAVNDALAVVPATADFNYFGNGGVFGTSAVFGSLHYAGGKVSNNINDILNGLNEPSPADNFAGNNNDLAAGNVHVAPFAGSFPGLTESGSYAITVSGALKGNSSSADFGFSVASNTITIGACVAQ